MTEECKIIRELAKGGQKTVYLADHPSLGKVVIKKGEIRSFTSLERIKREIELLSELKSDFYPEQYHFSIDVKTKQFEIIEDYIEGNCLRDSMGQFSTPKQIFILLKSIAEALSIIWDRNIVHRDLKPENIIIRNNGMPCIIDLGIARFLDLESLTKTIAPMGPCTPIYASPEQLANNKVVIDHRTDFFALGIIALELYLKRHPFDSKETSDTYSIVENIMANKYITGTETTDKSAGLSQFAFKTLQPQPYLRFRNYEMLKAFIENQL